MRFLVTGAAGQLGSAMVERLSSAGSVTPLTRAADVLQAVRATRPDVIVNCSAYNHVDDAEDQATQALDVNAFGVLALARAARESGAVFVHYSTDFVFDGQTSRHYTENDPPAPQSNYGLSKLL